MNKSLRGGCRCAGSFLTPFRCPSNIPPLVWRPRRCQSAALSQRRFSGCPPALLQSLHRAVETHFAGIESYPNLRIQELTEDALRHYEWAANQREGHHEVRPSLDCSHGPHIKKAACERGLWDMELAMLDDRKHAVSCVVR